MRCKVVHLSSVHYPFDTRVFHKECVSLANAGYDVTLVAPYAGESAQFGSVRLRAVAPPRNRWERFTRTIPAVYRAAIEEDAAIYHYHDPELMPVGALLGMRGKRVIYDVHEDYSGAMSAKRWIPRSLRGFAAFGVQRCEQFFAARCSRVVAATSTIAAKFPHATVSLVQNFPWLAELDREGAPAYRTREPIVAHVGTLSRDRGLVEMTEAVKIAAARKPLRLLLAGLVKSGAGAGIDDLIGNLPIEMLGLLPRIQVAELLGRARIGIVTLHPTRNYLPSQPTKLYEYMSAAIPVVASNFPAWCEIVDSSRCGLVVDPLDPDAIANAILWLLDHPAEAEEMGRRGRAAVRERFNWEREADRLLSTYAELAPDEETLNAQVGVRSHGAA
ncbi:MAG: glycosyltransferase family 4 protein [Terracidiphilus sp.]